jgi:hypothetical protein
MTSSSPQSSPPALAKTSAGKIDRSSLADVIEWFLNYDERTARMRHPQVEELFKWKQADDSANGIVTYPFENAEARFAVGIVQALEQNDSEPLLKLWISDVLGALNDARQLKSELTEAYGLDRVPIETAIAKSEKLTTNVERRAYLTGCWHDALFTAEARVLGWIYQELYGRPFSA